MIRLLVVAIVCAAACQALPQSTPTPAIQAPAQENSVSLSPSEAYKAAMSPFNAAKAQPDDLTDADKFALGIGMAQASHDCIALSADMSGFATDEKELIALSELCLFGRQYEPARATLVKYLALPEPPERKLALVLLVRALLGLGEPDGAYLQVSSLLHDYPYDAQIHFAIDQVIDAMEDGIAEHPIDALQLLQICEQQNVATLPLLARRQDARRQRDQCVSERYVLRCDTLRCSSRSAG